MTSDSIRPHNRRPASFGKTRRYEAKAPLEDVQRDLAWLEAHRRRLARRHRFHGWAALVVLLGTLGATFALADSRADEEITLATLIAGGVAFVALLVARRRYRAIESRRILLVRLLLREFDIRPGSAVALHLDLADIFCRRKAAGRENGRETFRDPWLGLRVELTDGSSIGLERTEELSYHKLHELNAIIYRWHTVNTDQVTIELPPGVGAARATQTVAVPEGMAAVAQSFADGAIRIRLASGDKWGAHATAAREGLLDLPLALVNVIECAYVAAGLRAPFRAEDAAAPGAR